MKCDSALPYWCLAGIPFAFSCFVMFLRSHIFCPFLAILFHTGLYYLTSTRCPPCKAIKPVYEELATKYSDVAFGKVDVDDNSDAAMEHQISAVPTFIFFDGEDPIERFSGADPNQLESLIKDLDSR